MTDLATTPTAELEELEELVDEARGYVAAAVAPATIRAYRSDWTHFAGWCDQRRLDTLPATPETVVLYLSDLAGVLAVSTLQRRLTSISRAHQAAGHPTPTAAPVVKAAWRGIRRTFGVAQAGVAPARLVELRAMVDQLPAGAAGDRDRALLLVGFAGAFRRSELVALDVDDLEAGDRGLVVTVRRSKTDQDGAGEEVAIPFGSDPATCPVRALRRWLDDAGIETGAVFRSVDRHGRVAGRRLSDRAVALVVKRSAERAGLDPSRFSGHSLRAGLITSAAEAGVAERDIMRQSRHRSVPVMRRYVRRAGLFDDNAASAVGL